MTDTLNTTPVDLTAEGLAQVPQDFPEYLEQASVASGTKGLTKGILWKASRDRITTMPGLNVRGETPEYLERIERIAKSMHAEGWYDDKPLACFVDKSGALVVKDGHTRLRAYDRAVELGAQIDYIPVVASSDYNMADVTVGLVKSNDGAALRPIEVAIVCKRLKGWGWEPAKIAERLDMSVAYVNELLALVNAPPALVKLVEEGTVSASTAVKAIKQKGAVQATQAIVEKAAEKKAAAKPGKQAKVVDSDLGQSKAQVAVQKAARSHVRKPRQSEAAGTPKVVDPMTALRAVFDDPAFAKLDDKVQCMVLDICAP